MGGAPFAQGNTHGNRFEPGNTVGRQFEPGNTLGRKHAHTKLLPDGRVVRSLTYNSWRSMNDRCLLESHRCWQSYGGRGITVCERWRRGNKQGFANFLADMGERPSKEHTLDRKHVNEGYSPDNCRWADKPTQAINTRRTNKVRGIQ